MAARGISTAGALRRAPEFLFLDAPALARVLQPTLQAGGPARADPGALRDAVLAGPDAARLLAIPREFWPLAVAALEIGRHTVSALGSKGIVRLEQLDGLAAEDLPWLGGITPGGAAGVERAVRRICRPSPEPVVFARWTDQSGTLRLPDLPLTVLHKVARAERFDEELRALVGCLRPRNAALVLARWGRELGEREVAAFLTYLAAERGVASSTQTQALCALLFLYDHVLERPLARLRDLQWAQSRARVPVVLTRQEVEAVLAGLTGVPRLVALLLYGGGLRLLECLQLRVKDVDLERGEIRVRDTKGGKPRVTVLPEALRGRWGRISQPFGAGTTRIWRWGRVLWRCPGRWR